MSRLHASLPKTGTPSSHPQQAEFGKVSCFGLSVLMAELPLPPEDKKAIQYLENMYAFHRYVLPCSQASTTCT